MTALYYFNPLTVKTMSTPDVALWENVYRLIGTAVGMCDRTETFTQPVNLSIYPKCQLPQLYTTSLTYDDCIDLRVKEIYEASVKLNKPIGILWSGGIDSTAVMVGFLRNYSLADLKSRIKVIMSTESSFENYAFYKDYVIPNFELITSEMTPWLFDGSMIIVTGEFNDQLFGSDLIKFYLTSTGYAEINDKFSRDKIFKYVNSKIKNEKVSNILIDAVIESSIKTNITLEKNNDFFWWYNFCFKWQCVHFRIYALAFPSLLNNINETWDNTFMYHFYQTDDFQRWSISNPGVRYITDWKNYKYTAKESIYAFNNELEYFTNKVKRPSLYTVFNHRILNEAVTSDFKILEKFNPRDYYNTDNMFK